MDRRKLLLLALSVPFGVVSWAAGQIASPFWWLPFVALPVAVVAMLLIGALLGFDYLKATRRARLPGFGVHLAIRVSDIQEPRRQYIFDLGGQGKPGAAFYLSNSRRFVFLIRDTHGEPYSLEVPAGWLGFPIADPAYFALEAGTDGITTVMRAMVNGRILHERTLPFAVDFTGLGINDLVVGASHDKTHQGGFALFQLVMVQATLTDDEARDMASYMAGKVGAPIGA